MKKQRICAKVETYTDRDGKPKNKYTEIGVIMQGERGPYVLLDPGVNLAGLLIQQNAINNETRNRLMCSVFDDEPRGESRPPQQQSTAPRPSAVDFDDDIGF
jgi:hypothetical protein